VRPSLLEHLFEHKAFGNMPVAQVPHQPWVNLKARDRQVGHRRTILNCR
jgi:hypothetical protein